MSSDSLPELLCRVEFPLYGITVLSPKHLLVGGGGGAAKTGVKNGFVSHTLDVSSSRALLYEPFTFQEIFSLSHNGKHTVAESMNRFETGEFAVMNLASAQYQSDSLSVVLAVGQNENTQLYKLQMARDKSQGESEPRMPFPSETFISYFSSSSVDPVNNGGPPRKGSHASNEGPSQKIIFNVKPMKNVQTDFK